MKWELDPPVDTPCYEVFNGTIRTNVIQCFIRHEPCHEICVWEEIPSHEIGNSEYFWSRIDEIGKRAMSIAKERGWI